MSDTLSPSKDRSSDDTSGQKTQKQKTIVATISFDILQSDCISVKLLFLGIK